MTRRLDYFTRINPGAMAFIAFLWAQGAIIGYLLYLKILGEFSMLPLMEFIEIQFSQNILTIAYIEIATSVFFTLFGFSVGLILKNLRQANSALQRLSQIKDQYVARCSHDLKSPLTNMRGFAELLYQEGELGADEKEMAGCILKNVDELKLFIDDILDLNDSQILSERASLEIVDANVIVKKVVSQHSNLAAKKGVAIRYHCDLNTPVSMMGHSTLMTRCIENLVSNAVKFTRSGDKIVVNLEQCSGRVVIKVEDTGVGIPQHKIAELFSEAGFRRRGTSGERSNGIGLRVVAEGVKTMHGKINVRSTEGKGSQFELIFPDPSTENSPLEATEKAQKAA